MFSVMMHTFTSKLYVFNNERSSDIEFYQFYIAVPQGCSIWHFTNASLLLLLIP